jgi:hypothetical protein
VLNGHVHAYERIAPVADGELDPERGIPHITVGDGGNREQFAVPWLPEQPAWSVLREYAYGWGTLALNRTRRGGGRRFGRLQGASVACRGVQAAIQQDQQSG